VLRVAEKNALEEAKRRAVLEAPEERDIAAVNRVAGRTPLKLFRQAAVEKDRSKGGKLRLPPAWLHEERFKLASSLAHSLIRRLAFPVFLFRLGAAAQLALKLRRLTFGKSD